MAKRLKSRPRVLLILCFLLLGSALIRGVEIAGPAIAAVSERADDTPPEPVAGNPEEDALLAALLERDAILKDREQKLEERLAMLNIAEAELTAMIDALDAAEAKLAATIALSETASSDDIALLTKVYQQMKPKDAAAVFEQMTPEFAAGFLGAMKPDGAAAVLSGLSPEKAYAISVLLAGRNAKAPAE
ncbi:MotE family protein [Cognatishimia sp. MH4019]|uniref:MotE family protein n=1 Tax=Cognatishimia sp. MH4019 TaxID=2854030 RepID=UPI001CD3F2C6|nr:hypothetical protein [Cognatishimia sp. MH4019]